LSQAYFSALTPHRQMPAVVTTSQGGLPSSPCTITAWPGRVWSGEEVAATRHCSSASSAGLARPRTASADSCALVMLGSPVAGSIT